MYTPSMIAAASVAAALHGLDWTGKSGYGLARLLDELTRITAIEQVSNVRIRRVRIASWAIATRPCSRSFAIHASYGERDVSRRSIFKFFKPAVRRRTPPVARRRLASGARQRWEGEAKSTRNAGTCPSQASTRGWDRPRGAQKARREVRGKGATGARHMFARAGKEKKNGGPGVSAPDALRAPYARRRGRRRRDRHSVSFPFPLASSFLSFLSTFLSSFLSSLLSLYMPSTNKPREWMRLCMRSVTRKRNIFNDQSSSGRLELERVRKT